MHPVLCFCYNMTRPFWPTKMQTVPFVRGSFMIARIAFAVLLSASFALAKPAAPTTRPAQPTTKPAEAKSGFAKDIIAKFQAQKQKESELAKVGYIDLDQPVAEKPAEFVLFADTRVTLKSLLDRLTEAKQDKDLRAVLVNLGATGFNLSQAQELRDAFVDLRKANKRVFIFADSYDTTSYIAASGATDICILEGGEIFIPGVGLETMFAKGLLDKVGVKADYVQIGQYKGADEQYTRTEASKELREEMNKLVDALFEQIVDGIAYSRNISRHDVKEMINGVMLNGKAARERKFVDHLVDQDGLRDLMKKELGRDVNLVHNYGIEKREAMDFSNPFAFLSSLAKKPAAEEESDKPQVALIYAEGVIIDGEAEDGIFGPADAVGSENMRKALRIAGRDENIKAVVIRIDSPGGSALASEVMWQAARRVAKDKPVIISIGGMAASGGYYLASAGHFIYADPTAIVGSIGVVGGKFVLKDLFDKVGLRTETFARGSNAGLFSSNEPFSDTQKRLVTAWMQRTYDQFTERVMTTRKGKIKDIDDVAHGRIFLAKQAKQLGMVDELGGLDKAIAHAADKAKLKAGEFDVRTVPATRTLGDLLTGSDPDSAAAMPFRPSITIGPESILRSLSPSTARLLRQQMQVLQLLQNRPVMLVSPYVITVK